MTKTKFREKSLCFDKIAKYAKLRFMKFNLHRPQKNRADWENAAAETLNSWQKIAAATSGIITPSNLMDAGAAAAEQDLSDRILRAQKAMSRAKSAEKFVDAAEDKKRALIADQFLLPVDVLDGIVANETGTKSPLGEKVDVASDMWRTFVKTRTRLATGEFSTLDAGILLAPKLLNAATGGIALARGGEFHTTRFAKYAEVWRAMAFFAADVGEIIKTDAQISLAESYDLPYLASNDGLILRESPEYRRAKEAKKVFFGAAGLFGIGVSVANVVELARNGSVK